MAKKKDFWDKFSDTMDSLGDYIDETFKSATKGMSSVKSSSVTISQRSINGKESLEINGHKYVKYNGYWVPKDLVKNGKLKND